MFTHAAERLEVLRSMGWPGHGHPHENKHFCHAKVNDVVTEIIHWRHERPKPRPWHYVIRAYRRVVLARKDWRLPWR